MMMTKLHGSSVLSPLACLFIVRVGTVLPFTGNSALYYCDLFLQLAAPVCCVNLAQLCISPN